MLTITTTNNLDGYEVVEYLGIVTGEAVSGINMFRDIGAGLRNVFGGRSAGYEDEMSQAREEVLNEMSQRAEALGAKRRHRGIRRLRDIFRDDYDHRLRHRRPRSSQGVARAFDHSAPNRGLMARIQACGHQTSALVWTANRTSGINGATDRTSGSTVLWEEPRTRRCSGPDQLIRKGRLPAQTVQYRTHLLSYSPKDWPPRPLSY